MMVVLTPGVLGGVQNTGSTVNTQQKQVSSLIKHASYSSASMKNDIMLIKLSFVSNVPYVHSKNLPKF